MDNVFLKNSIFMESNILRLGFVFEKSGCESINARKFHLYLTCECKRQDKYQKLDEFGLFIIFDKPLESQ